MYSCLKTTPRAGARLTEHLRTLILTYGVYHPPFATLAGTANTAPRPTQVPPEILTDAVIEDIKSSCCFVGQPMDNSISIEAIVGFDTPPSDHPMSPHDDRMSVDTDQPSPASRMLGLPAETTLGGRRSGGSSAIHSGIQSGIQSGTQSGVHTPSRQQQQTPFQSAQDAYSARFERQSRATDFMIQVNPPPPLSGTGRGSIRIPGWIRERAAEQLFQGGDVDECSVTEVILYSLLKVRASFYLKIIL
jgi:actin-related protein 10